MNILGSPTLTSTALAFLFSSALMANEIEDVSFESPLFCDNDRKSIKYAAVSFNINRFSKITDLAYFTDGYPNAPVSNFYTASRYKIEANVLDVDLKMLIGGDVTDYGPQKSGEISTCRILLDEKWRSKIEVTGDVSWYETDSFSAICQLGLSDQVQCRTSDDLARSLKLVNPYGGATLPYSTKFRYRTWKE
ncbi:MAG: hypothetical protein J4A00_06250 [Gammaproteobacteria bacterium]|nr:hypothetical protein [Gammaproteobacteria bacterium]